MVFKSGNSTIAKNFSIFIIAYAWEQTTKEIEN